MLDLASKDFKAVIINMLKEEKKIMLKKLKEGNGNVSSNKSKVIELINESNGSSGAEKYN